MESLWQDLRYAMRALVRNRGFTAVAVVTLALGIGANAAIFTTVEAALLRPLPYSDADRIVHLWETTPTQPTRQLSYPDFLDVRERARGFTGVAGYASDGYDLAGPDGPERVLHDRRPIMLPPTLLADWIHGSADGAARIALAAPDLALTWHPVSPAVGNVRHQGPQLAEPIQV